jgi:CheY-like chemotaxis protein
MNADKLSEIAGSSNKVMIVDDDRSSRVLLRSVMAKLFDVVTCASGAEALATFDTFKPDLILLDVEMPGLNGFETCIQIRQRDTRLPIIFVTANQSFEEHLKAYDAGGDDLITKPVDQHILLRKATLAIRHKADKERLAQEARSLHEMAMSFLSTAGESGVLLNFVRKAVEARSYPMLAGHLVEAASEFGVQCSVMLRHQGENTIVTSHGEPNHLEQSILEQMSGMGRMFQFQRQFIVNYEQVSVMISNAQTDSPEKVGRIRDNTAILAETAEALCENVFMRIQSIARAEQMQVAQLGAASAVERLHNNHSRLLLDTRILLQQLVDNVESTYAWLNTSQSQETAISERMNQSIQKILVVLATGNQFDEEINSVLNVLRGENSNSEVDLW